MCRRSACADPLATAISQSSPPNWFVTDTSLTVLAPHVSGVLREQLGAQNAVRPYSGEIELIEVANLSEHPEAPEDTRLRQRSVAGGPFTRRSAQQLEVDQAEGHGLCADEIQDSQFL